MMSRMTATNDPGELGTCLVPVVENWPAFGCRTTIRLPLWGSTFTNLYLLNHLYRLTRRTAGMGSRGEPFMFQQWLRYLAIAMVWGVFD